MTKRIEFQTIEFQHAKCPQCNGTLERYGNSDWYHFLEEDAATCPVREYGGRGE